MSSKLVIYDLCAPGRNYDKLYESIKSYPKWAHITESTWFIKTDESCSSIRNKLMNCLDKNDRLFVAELTGEAAWNNILCSNEYLKNNL